MGFERVKQIMKSMDEVAVAQPVIDDRTLFTSTHKMEIQQFMEMLRGSRGSQPQLIGDLSCA